MTKPRLPRKFFISNRDTSLDRVSIANIIAIFIKCLPLDKAYWIGISEHNGTRSNAQNAYLWGVVYPQIMQQGGEEMQGWTAQDLHDFFLISHFGSEVKSLFCKKRHIPMRRSSKLSKMEFVYFIAHIQQFMAERGVVIEDPSYE